MVPHDSDRRLDEDGYHERWHQHRVDRLHQDDRDRDLVVAAKLVDVEIAQVVAVQSGSCVANSDDNFATKSENCAAELRAVLAAGPVAAVFRDDHEDYSMIQIVLHSTHHQCLAGLLGVLVLAALVVVAVAVVVDDAVVIGVVVMIPVVEQLPLVVVVVVVVVVAAAVVAVVVEAAEGVL